MRFVRQILFMTGFAACLGAAPVTSACPSGTCADYIAASICKMGSVIYKSFSFADLTGGFGPPDGQLTSASFGVSPDFSTGGFSIAIPAGTYYDEKYLLTYVVDPAPILGGEELSMDLFGGFAARAFGFAAAISPSATASKWACPQGFFGNTVSPGQPVGPESYICHSPYVEDEVPFFLQVKPGESDSAVFPEPVFFTHVRILFELDGRLGPLGVSTAPIVVPEPGTNLLLAGGLIALLAARKRRR